MARCSIRRSISLACALLVLCPATASAGGLTKVLGQLLKKGARRASGPKAPAGGGSAGSDPWAVPRRVPGEGRLRDGVSTLGRGFGPPTQRLVQTHGAAGAWTIVRHPSVAVDLIRRYDESAIRALNTLSRRNGRRLAILDCEGHLSRAGRAREVLDTVARFGDRALEFLWKHKGILAGGAILADYLHDPKPYIDGGRAVVDSAAIAVAQAAAAPLEEAAKSIGVRTNWTVVLCVVAVLLAAVLYRRSRRAHLPARAMATLAECEKGCARSSEMRALPRGETHNP